MKPICHDLRWILVLAWILVCQGCYHDPVVEKPRKPQPTIEELEEFIWKTREELVKKFPPDGVGYISELPPSPIDEKKLNEWREYRTDCTLFYGDLRMDVNHNGDVYCVYRYPITGPIEIKKKKRETDINPEPSPSPSAEPPAPSPTSSPASLPPHPQPPTAT